MSDTDSFVDEVTEEVQRDRMIALVRRFGWIAVVAVLLIVGGASWNEYRKAQQQAQAQSLGDTLIAALEKPDAAARSTALAEIMPDGPSVSVIEMIRAGEYEEAGQGDDAAAALGRVAQNPELAGIYQKIAQFKLLQLADNGLDAAARRSGFEALAVPGDPLRLLAEEQLALLDIAEKSDEAAIERLTAIALDAEATTGLRQRATEVIVALGGDAETLLADLSAQQQ